MIWRSICWSRGFFDPFGGGFFDPMSEEGMYLKKVCRRVFFEDPGLYEYYGEAFCLKGSR